jgi:hypothetical protein
LVLWLSSLALSQSEADKPDTPTRADQSAKEIILIGELHGTEKTPRLCSNLVSVAAREKNKRIGVGLELPIILQQLIDKAVKDNADSFREELLAHRAWQKIDDGRSSQAMLDLICDMLKPVMIPLTPTFLQRIPGKDDGAATAADAASFRAKLS